MTHCFAARAPARHPGMRPARRPRTARHQRDLRGPRARRLVRRGRQRPGRRNAQGGLLALVRPARRRHRDDRGPSGGRPLLDQIIGVVERHFWSEDEGASVEAWDRAWRESEAYRGANANMHMVEAFLAARDATGDPIWAERALRIAQRLVRDVAGAHDWRVVEHFDAEWTPLPEYNRAEVRAPVPALRRDAGPRARVVAPPAASPQQPRRSARAGSSRPRRDCSRERSRTAGRRTAGSSTRPTSKGSRSSRIGCTGCSPKASAPPRRCTPSPAPRSTTAGTRRSGTSRTRGSAIASTEAGDTSSTTSSSRASAHGRASRTSTTRSRRRCFRGCRSPQASPAPSRSPDGRSRRRAYLPRRDPRAARADEDRAGPPAGDRPSRAVDRRGRRQHRPRPAPTRRPGRA